MKKIGVLYHPMIKAASSEAREIEQLIKSNGGSVWLSSAWEKDKARTELDGTELILSIGGDGTILRAANIVATTGIPIVGVNLGKLGFLTELSIEEVPEKLPALLRGEGWSDERAMLEAEVSSKNQGQPRSFYALNDVVVAREAIARLVHIETTIDGQFLTTYKADGVIVATATGSSAYSLAAGGPILYPQSQDFLLVPIMPHLCSSYSLVLSARSTVQLRLSNALQATVSIDGHINLPVLIGTAVTVKRSTNCVRFLRIHPRDSFYGRLEQRLKGKQ